MFKTFLNKPIKYFGLILILVLIILANPIEIIQHLKNIQFSYLLPVALLLSLSSLIGAFNIFLLTKTLANIAFKKLLSIYWLGWAISLVFPGQVGDVITIPVLLKKHINNTRHIFIIVILDKLISLFLLLIICLLYTSPSPRDKRQSRMPSSA